MKEFIRLEFELVLTFVNLAHTKYLIGDVAAGDVSRKNAEKAFWSALYYFGKLSDVPSVQCQELMGLAKKAEHAIATLPKAANE